MHELKLAYNASRAHQTGNEKRTTFKKSSMSFVGRVTGKKTFLLQIKYVIVAFPSVSL